MKILPFPKTGKSSKDFEQILRPHLEHMYRLAYRFCQNQDDAEDLVQDVLTKLYARRIELAEIEHLKSWIGKVLYRQFVDNIRQRSRSPIKLHDDDTMSHEPPDRVQDQPDNVMETDQELARVEAAYNQLSDEHRVVIALHDMEGYPLNEITEILDIPIGTLKSRLHRARKSLREILDYQ